MKVPFVLVKSFLRNALYPSGTAVSALADAVAALVAIQGGFYTEATADDTTTIASTVEGKTFQFQITPGLSKSQIMAICEEAIELIETMSDANSDQSAGLTEAEMVDRLRRKYLRKRSRTRSDFSSVQY